MPDFRIGIGYDVHQFSEGRDLVLCGNKIPHHLGLLGHSDADVAIHALIDAMLGALALGDIGSHFPDTDPEYDAIDSRVLLKRSSQLVSSKGYKLSNLDLTIVAERPKLLDYIYIMRETLASDLEVALERVSVKATTSEKMGFVGRGEGISCHAVVMLKSYR